MSKPIIGIAANQLPAGSADFLGNPITYTPQGFVTATEQVGGLPLLLPISTPESAVAYINQIDKLLLAGGQDVDPQFYGEDPHPKLGATNLECDLFERALITEVLKKYNISMIEGWEKMAESYAIDRGGRSGRLAKQFAAYLYLTIQ